MKDLWLRIRRPFGNMVGWAKTVTPAKKLLGDGWRR
jgi:hypothetical protein